MYQDRVLAISSEPNAATMLGLDTASPPSAPPRNGFRRNCRSRRSLKATSLSIRLPSWPRTSPKSCAQHAHELLTRHETKRLLDALAETQPKLVEELVPKLLTLGEVQKVLQQLLREQVSIRDLPAILETLLDTAPINKNPVQLVETVRQTLGRALVQPLLSSDGKLHLLALDPSVEDEINQAFDPQAAGRGHARQPRVPAQTAGQPEAHRRR